MLNVSDISRSFVNITAILPAAGIGSRMKSILPKQYIIIKNKTLIEYSIRAVLYQSYIKHCIVVLNNKDRWFDQLSISKDPRISVVIGGKTRADSVMAGLKNVKNSIWVLIHDAVRPCLYWKDLENLFKITKFSQIGGILATPISNTIKCTYSGSNLIHYSLDRNNLWNALTPQLFNYNLLKFCLQEALNAKISIADESEAIEYCGYKSVLVPGRSDNIKVTYQGDLKLVSFYLSKLYEQ